jgi:hypothetical protein
MYHLLCSIISCFKVCHQCPCRYLLCLRREEGKEGFSFGLIDDTKREIVLGDKFEEESTVSFVMGLLFFWFLVELLVSLILLLLLLFSSFFYRSRDIRVESLIVRLIVVCARQSTINHSWFE